MVTQDMDFVTLVRGGVRRWARFACWSSDRPLEPGSPAGLRTVHLIGQPPSLPGGVKQNRHPGRRRPERCLAHSHDPTKAPLPGPSDEPAIFAPWCYLTRPTLLEMQANRVVSFRFQILA